MKFPVSWLREWVPQLPETSVLAERLTMAGLEVEALTALAPPFSGVVVGQVLSVAPHPNADKLRVCEVAVGTQTPLTIVCGAPNVTAGMKAPCARVGAHLPDGTVIREAKLRGVTSHGMLCSARELGLSDDHSGLMRLPAEAPVGADVRTVLGLDDEIVELKLTPNRGDCLSILGLAREVAALFDLPLRPYGAEVQLDATRTRVVPAVAYPFDARAIAGRRVSLSAPHACPRYLGLPIEGVDAGRPTPEWMRRRLEACGMRSVNLIVDITNYVMLELGQPLHAFDAAKLDGDITVRWAHAGESFTTLTGETLALSADTLVIADGRGAVAMAGVMGGAESGVSATTRAIFLESAFFSPVAIAGRARRYGLNSEAAHRFERGVDPEGAARALARAAYWIVTLAGGKAGAVVAAESPEHLPCRHPIAASWSRLEGILGVRLPRTEGEGFLVRLGFAVQQDTGSGAPAASAGSEHGTDDTLVVTPPSWRFDVRLPEDLAEELARGHGYERIPAVLPRMELRCPQAPESCRSRHAVRAAMRSLGYHEAVTYAFVPGEWETERLGNPQPIALANPIASHQAVMRSSLLPGLVEAVANNRKRQAERVRLFEIGRCFLAAEPITAVTAEALTEALNAQQPLRLAAVAWGTLSDGWWQEAHRAVDFYDVKGDLENLLAPLALSFSPAAHPLFHPGRCAAVQLADKTIGILGELHPRWAQVWELHPTPVMFEIALDAVLHRPLPQHREVPRTPLVARDLAFLLPETTPAAELVAALQQDAPPWWLGVELFDVYRGSGIPAGHKSVAIRIRMQAPDRTLTESEVDAAIAAAIARAQSVGAQLRH